MPDTCMKKSIAPLIMAGIMTLVSGCIDLNHKSPNNDSTYSQTPLKKNQFSKYLKKNEFIVPYNVFSAYEKASRTGPTYSKSNGNGCAGTCISDIIDDEDEFIKNLSDMNYSKKEINDYYKIFSTKGNIVLRELPNEYSDYYKTTLVHERMHYLQNNLNENDRQKIKDCWSKIMDKKYNNQDYSNILSNECKSHEDRVKKEVMLKWGEMLPYMTTIETDINEIIIKDYPEVCQIYNNMKEEAELK
jgi:hypothetical protein